MQSLPTSLSIVPVQTANDPEEMVESRRIEGTEALLCIYPYSAQEGRQLRDVELSG